MGLLDLFRRESDQDRFARMVAEHIRARGWPHEVVYEKERFALRLDGDKHVMFLQNIYEEWRKTAPSQRAAEIAKATNWLFEHRPELDFAAARSMLLPTIRNRSHIEAWRLDPHIGPGGEVRRVAYLPLCDVLAVGAVVDYPDSMTHVVEGQLSDWGVPFATVLSEATENLRARSPATFLKDDGGFLISQYNDHFDCSRLLLPDLFDRLSLRGAPVAIPVVRQGMVVAGEHDIAALLAMAAFAEAEVATATRPISLMPLVLREGHWQPFSPDAPNLASLRQLGVKHTLWDYQEQKPMLERLLAQQGRDVFVATLTGIKHDDSIHSFAVWTPGVVTMLPRAEAITFYRGKTASAMTRLSEDVATVCGARMRQQAFYPPRFLVVSGPTEAEIAMLETHFKAPAWTPALGP